jgi:hypothetical protein
MENKLSYLHFTIRNELGSAEGSGRDRFFASTTLPTLVPGILTASRPEYLSTDGTFYSPWAEVAYFLQPTGERVGLATDSDGQIGMRVHTLFRRRRLLVDARAPNELPPIADTAQDLATEVSFHRVGTTATVVPNYPSDVTIPTNRFGMNITPPAGVSTNVHTFPTLASGPMGTTMGGDDVLMENVISFEIRANWDVPNDPRLVNFTTNLPNPFATPNTDYPFDDLPRVAPVSNTGLTNHTDATVKAARVFDTWSTQGSFAVGWNAPTSNEYTLPLRIRIKALQIRLRVWDSRTQQTRQITIIQDM